MMSAFPSLRSWQVCSRGVKSFGGRETLQQRRSERNEAAPPLKRLRWLALVSSHGAHVTRASRAKDK